MAPSAPGEFSRPQMRGWTLARRLRTAVGAIALLFAIAVAAIVIALRQADHALSDQTQRILLARIAAKELLTSLVDQETGLRGYAITRQSRYLEPYRQGLANEVGVRARLEKFIGPQDHARLSLLTVDAAVTAWRDEYASLRLQDVLNGSAMTTIDFGRQLFERVRLTNASLDAALAGEASAAQTHANAERRLVGAALAALTVVITVALLGLQWALRTMVLRPMQGLAQQVAVISQGAHDYAIEASGPPDIREMGRGVELMRLELVRTLAAVEEQQRDLARRATELARSNADLEQFAYVASHDLQEPLRKVASFCQLIEQRYGGQLDERGEQYIQFAVDGAKRMQQLITDLLTFSRVGRSSEGFEALHLEDTITAAWAGLESRTHGTGAQLEVAIDGRAVGDASLLRILFDNLLGNAVKYRRQDVPVHIRISGSPEEGLLRVDVCDNGIGIPAKFASKVFVIFQRLHGREEYEGTGIGLALCKKVVEFHGGTIELRESPLGGACVSFTLPLEQAQDT